MAEGVKGVRIGWKEGKADEPLARARLVGWVPLRRFCPLDGAEAPTAVLGSWVVTSGANCSGRNGWGREPTCTRSGAPKGAPDGFSGGVSTRFRGIISGLDDVIRKQVIRSG